MAKGVLGNDPFQRGAAKREGVPEEQKPAAPALEAPKPRAPRPPAPPPAKWPTAVRKAEPARASVRVLMSSQPQGAGAPVLGAPPTRLRDWEPTSHPAAPELLGELGAAPEWIREFFAHPNTPEVVAVLGEKGGTAHRDSPEGTIRRVPSEEMPAPTRPAGKRSAAEVVKATGAPASPFRSGATGAVGAPAAAPPRRGSASAATVPSAVAPPAHRGSPEAAAVVRPSGPTQHRDSPEVGAELGAAGPTPHGGSPEVAAVLRPSGPTPHRDSPELAAVLRPSGPTPHRDSPEVAAVLRPSGPTPHRDSPEVAAVLRPSGPTPHRDSPEVAAVLRPSGPTPHRDSPEVAAVLRSSGPTPHRDSPEVAAVLGAAGPTPHGGSPAVAAVINSREPTPHHGSPVVAAVLGSAAHGSRAPATAHRDSPEVLADLDHDVAVPHPLSPEVLEIQGVSRVPPLVVEIIEESTPEPAMSDREISPAQRQSRPAVALGVVREIFAGGIARPMLGAARGLFQAGRTALGLGASADLDVWGKDTHLARTLEPFSDFVYDRYFRVTVDGADHVPSGACLLVANHSGALPLDGPMLFLALRRERADLPEARWLLEDQIFHAPFVGVLANRLGAVRANPENATRLLQEKRPVAVFPEGILGLSKPFSERYHLKRFGRGGYVKLAARLGVPIVPVAITGAEESMPLLALLPGGLFGVPYLPLTPPPLPARWRIRFGPPIELDAPPNAEDDLAWVARTNDRIKDTVEGMLTALLKARTSIF